MKRLMILILAAAAALVLATACDDSDTEYYVRYEGRYAGWSAGPDKTVIYEYTAPDGQRLQHTGGTMDITIGPVAKGFVAEVSATNVNWNRSSVAIYLARSASGPFVKSAAGGGYAKLVVGQY